MTSENRDYYVESIEFARNAGYDINEIITDGEPHRFSTNGKPNDTSGWYIAHRGFSSRGNDYFILTIGDWRTDRMDIYRSFDTGNGLDSVERAEMRDEHERHRVDVQRKLDKARAGVAVALAEKLKNAVPVESDHPYLVRKSIQPQPGVLQLGDRLAIPVMDFDGNIHSVQWIDSAGDKRFAVGGRTKGCLFQIGELNPEGRLCIAEGFATGATIFEITGLPVLVTFYAHNILAIAVGAAEKYPDADIILCADDDYLTEGNPGITKASAAAEEINAKLAIPHFSGERTKGQTDFNDMAATEGTEAVLDAINAAEQKGTPPRPPPLDALEAAVAISRLTDEDLKAGWLGVLERVESPSHMQMSDLLDVLVARGVGKKRPLQQDWTERRRKLASQDQAAKAKRSIEDTAGGRVRVVWDPENLEAVVRQAERAIIDDPDSGALFRYGGHFCRIDRTEPPRAHAIGDRHSPPPKVVTIAKHDKTSAEFRIRKSAAIVTPATERKPARIVPPPSELITAWLQTPTWQAPTIDGIELHPLILLDGRELSDEGLHRDTGLYLDFGGWEFDPLPEDITQEDARWARESIIEELFSDYEFEDMALDLSCAVAMIMTSFSRRLLTKAPAFLVTAARQGSGKTTLCQMIHMVNTGSELPVLSFNADENEAQKTIFASLAAGVHSMCFDNVSDGSTLSGTALAAIITSGTFSSRILGESKSATVPTNCMVMATGNNVSLDADLARRVITIRLAPSLERPEQHTYQHPDIFQHCIRVRRRLILAIMTITAGYMRAGAPTPEVPVSGMTEWDRLVRYPLIWSGAADPILKLEQNRDDSPVLASRNLVAIAGRQCFGDAEVSTSQILRTIAPEDGSTPSPNAQMFADALAEISDRANRSVRSLGRILGSMVGHKAAGVEICRTRSTHARCFYFKKLPEQP